MTNKDASVGQQESDSVESLLVPQRKVELAGEVVTIEPMRVRHLPVVTKAMTLFFERLASNADPLVVVGDCMPEISAAMAALTGKSAEWINDLQIEDGLTLAVVLLEANRDFFVTKVLPKLQTLGGAGSMSYSVSSQPGTPSTGS